MTAPSDRDKAGEESVDRLVESDLTSVEPIGVGRVLDPLCENGTDLGEILGLQSLTRVGDILDPRPDLTYIVPRMCRTVAAGDIEELSNLLPHIVLLDVSPPRDAIAALLADRVDEIIEPLDVIRVGKIGDLLCSHRITVSVVARIASQLSLTCLVFEIVD